MMLWDLRMDLYILKSDLILMVSLICLHVLCLWTGLHPVTVGGGLVKTVRPYSLPRQDNRDYVREAWQGCRLGSHCCASLFHRAALPQEVRAPVNRPGRMGHTIAACGSEVGL